MELWELLKKYKSIIFYLIFGVGTTVVNIIVYYLCSHIANMPTVASTCMAWVFAVLFAYVTNRTWVFESKARIVSDIITEMMKFFSCRLATGVIDVAIMYVFVDLIGLNDVIIKTGSNILVIVLNYVASKLIIFNKK